MLKMRKRKNSQKIYLTFLVCMMMSIGVFVYRVVARTEITPMTDGQIIMYSTQYQFGTIYDRNMQVIAKGGRRENKNIIEWGDMGGSEAFEETLGIDIKASLNDKTTLCGNCPWLYGTEWNGFSAYAFMHPEERTGGSVKLTIDKGLQEYVSAAVSEHGYENAGIVISNYQTGELLCVYGKNQNPFKAETHPGSTIKPIIAAAVLSADPSLENYVYNCTKDTHVFQTESGAYEINCMDNKAHGLMNMTDAIAYSCNGYFVSLMQQVDKNVVLQELKKWGYDSVTSYSPQFMCWDHSFLQGSSKDSDYLLASIGQANAYMSPVGLTMCVNTLLNHGVFQQAIWFTEKQSSQDAKWTKVNNVSEKRVICSEEVADTVTEMMRQVTAYGSGETFWLPDFVAKTGTAQKKDAADLYTVWTTGGLKNTETPYSITVCLDNVSADISSADAGNLAREILLYMTGGQEQ